MIFVVARENAQKNVREIDLGIFKFILHSPCVTTEFDSITSVTADTVAVLLLMVNSEVLAYKGFFLSSIGDVRTMPLKF